MAKIRMDGEKAGAFYAMYAAALLVGIGDQALESDIFSRKRLNGRAFSALMLLRAYRAEDRWDCRMS
jgi:hypothetical protein